MKTLKDIIEAAGYETRAYSGRYMDGKECLAVSLQRDSESQFCANLFEKTDSSYIALICSALRDAKTDALGRGTILYFLHIQP